MPIGRNGKNMNVNPRTAARYVKNVGRSLGYAMVESLGNNAPTLKALFSDNKDTVQSIYQEIKEFASSPLDKIKSNEKLMSYSNDIKTGFANLKDDIKTGNFYNYERQNSAMMSMMGLDEDIFGDIDFDSDLADLDSDIASASTAAAASKEIDAMQDVGERVSTSVSMATAQSAEYIVKANAESTRAMINQTTRIFNSMSAGMLGINKTLGSIAQLAQPLTVHMQNSSVFYTETTKNQEKMIELLTTIAENTKKPEPKKANRKEYNGIEAFLGGDYGFNLSNMGSMMKKNAKEAFENSTLGMLAGMGDMFGEGSLIKMVASNPLGMAMPFLLEGMMSKKLKDSMKKLSDTMAAFNIKLIRDLNGLTKSSNPILSFIGQLFNYDDKNKGKRDTGEYEKGAISFDGVTKHAIVRVIPEYLGMILAKLGGPETKYDYKAGKFTTVKQIQAKKYKEERREIDNLAFETEMDINEAFVDKEEAQKIELAMKKYIGNALKEGNYIDPNSSDSDADKFGLSKKQFKQVKKLIKYYEQTHQGIKIEMLNQQIREARNAKAAAIIEDPYLSNEDYLLNNSIGLVSGGAYPVGTNGVKENKNKKKKNKKDKGSKGSTDIDPDDLDANYITQKLTEKGYNTSSNVYTSYMNKLNKASSTSDKERIIKQLNDLQNKSENSKFTNRLLGEDEEDTGIAKLLSSPMGFLADQMNKASDALYHIMYGRDKNGNLKNNGKDSSIVGNMLDYMKDIFTTFKDFLKKDIMDPIKKYFEDRGGLLKMITDFFGIDDPEGLKAFVKGKAKDLWSGVKGNLRTAGKWVVDNSPIKAFYNKQKRKKQAQANESHFEEMTDLITGAEEARNEHEIIELDDGLEGEGSRLRKMYAKGSGLRKFRGGATAEEVYEGGKQKLSEFFSRDGFGGEVGHTISDGLKSFFSSIMPDKDKANQDFDNTKKVIKTSIKEIGLDPSGAITGALLGGGVSLLTGGMISPMLAASIGAATGLTIKSNAVQDMLFGKMEDTGEKDENGNPKMDRMGGIFSKQLSDFMRKQLPDMAAWGATGGVLAMLPGVPGGPVAGMILGSALGFAHKNEQVQEFLWGKGEESGLLGSAEDRKKKAEWFKRMLPKAAAGAIIGAVAGPFGLVGNVFAGAALGFASETELFKSAVFGKEVEEKDEETGEMVKVRKGGIAGWIKKDIVGPVAGAIAPIAVEIKNKGKDIIRWTIRSIADVFGKTVGSPIFKTLYEKLLKPIGKLVPGITKLAGGIISAPFKAIGAIGTGLRKKQIRTGRANDMTAKDRLQYRRNNRMEADEFTDFDTTIANMDIEGEGGLQEAIARVNSARKTKNPEEIDAAVKEFATKFGLQNANVTDKNIDKWLDTVKGEVKNRKTDPEAVKIDLDKMRNTLMEGHYKKTEEMLGLLINKMFKRKIYDVEVPGNVEEEAKADEKEKEENVPSAIKDTRRSFATTVKSIFNPFTGMDMPSVNAAIAYYEDTLAGNNRRGRKAYKNAADLKQRVRKVTVDGKVRDDVIQVTDKNGYTVTVQKKNGAWMPYKLGEQLLESSGLGGAVKSIKSIAAGVKTGFTFLAKAFTGNPFYGIDEDVVTKTIEIYFDMKYEPEKVSAEDEAFFHKHGRIFDSKYNGEYVLQITDDDGHVGIGRYDNGVWKPLGLGWRVKQTAKSIGNAIAKTARKIGSAISRGINAIRHINPFCDFESNEVGPIVDSLNAMEDGGSDETGKIKRVRGLKHYYQVTSDNGAVVTVTPKFGKWTYVSSKELARAKARYVTAGLGNLIKNTALKAINAIGNKNNVESKKNEESSGSGSMLKKFIGAGSQFSLFGALKTKIAKDGQEVIDAQDKESRTTLKIRDNFINKFNDIADYVKKIFGKLPGEEEKKEEEEKKKGLLESIFNSEDGMLGGLLGFFTGGTGLKGAAGKILAKFNLGAALKAGVGLGVLALLFSGALDGLGEAIGNLPIFRNPDKSSGFKDTEGSEASNKVKTGTLGKVFNGKSPYETITTKTGETKTVYTDRFDDRVKVGSDNSISSNMIRNTVTGAIVGNGSVATAIIKKTTGLNLSTGGVVKGLKELGTLGANSSVVGGIMVSIEKLLAKLPNILTKIPFLPSTVKASANQIANTLYTNINTAVEKIASNPKIMGIASKLSNALIIAKVAYVAAKGIDAWGNAESILGITQEATTGQRIIAVLIAVANALIPIIGDLIPNNVLVNIFMTIAPKIGIDVSSLQEQRDAAAKELEAYKEATGDDSMTIEKYNQLGLTQNEDGTFSQGKSRAGIITKAKMKVGGFIDNVKDQGFGKAIADTGVGKAIGTAATNVKNAVGNAVDVGKNSLASINNSSKDIAKFIFTGDIKGLLAYDPLSNVGEDNPLAKVLKVAISAEKYMSLPQTAISWVGHKIFDGIKKIIDVGKQSITSVAKSTIDIGKFVAAGDTKGLIEYNPMSNITDENPIGKLLHGIIFAEKMYAIPKAGISKVAHNVFNAAKKVFDIGKKSVTGIAKAQIDINKYTAAGDINGLLSYDTMTNVAEDDVIGKFTNTAINIEKYMSVPKAALSWVGHKVSDAIKKVIEGGKAAFAEVISVRQQIDPLAKAGDIEGLNNLEYNTDESNPIAGFGKVIFGISKFMSYPMAGISWVGHKIAEGVTNIINGVKNGAITYFSMQDRIDEYVKAGDVTGLLESSFQSGEGEEQGGFWGGFYNISKYANVIPASISWIGHKAFDGIKEGFGKIKEDANTLTENALSMQSTAMEEGAGFGRIKTIWEKSPEYTSPISGIFNVITTIQKVVFTLTGVLAAVAEPIKGLVDKVKGVVGGVVDTAKEWVGNAADAVGNAWDTLWNGKSETSGAGSFISQVDPRVANRKFGTSTIGDNGCAPSVASMVTGYDLGTTASMATKGGFANDHGTSADYFGKVFGSAGIPAEYVYTGAGSAQDYLANRIASGSPTVLLGQDRSNTSKAYSPFGPGNHYVLATGMTNNGGVVVQDPESSRPNMVYDRSILNSVKLGIPTGGKSGLRRARRLRGGRAVEGTDAVSSSGGVSSVKGTGNATENQKQIWTFLRKKGLSEAGAAGLMGCWQAESGNRPDRIEGDYMKLFPGFGKVASSSDALDNYTVNILFPAYKNIKINQSAYKASDGHYYPGFGLAQWTGGRGLELFNFCKTKHWDWKTLKAQLEFAWSELSGKYSGVLSELKKDGDVAAMCKIAYNKYEGCKREDWLQTRQKYAAEIYTALTGRTYTVPMDAGTDSFTYGIASSGVGEDGAMAATNGDNSAGGLAGGLLSLGSMFGKLFSSAFGKLGALFGLSSDESEEALSNGVSGEENLQETDTNAAQYNSGVAGSRTSNNFPYYNQGSEPWGSMMYSATNNKSQTIKTSGCGPTSMAMVLKSYGKQYDPGTAANYSLSKGYRTANSGTSWGFFKDIGEKEGLTVSQFSDADTAKTYLGKNIPVIASMGPGYFTKGGHYVVLSGMSGNKLMVNDPASEDRTNKLWGLDDSLSQGKQFWAVSNNGVGSINNSSTSLDSGEFLEGNRSTNAKVEIAAKNKNMSAAGSGLAGSYNIANDAYNTMHRRHRSSNSVFGAGSKIVNLSGYTDTRKAKYVSNLISNMRASGSATNDEVMVALLKAMITLLSNMSTNSDKINVALGSIGSILESKSMSGNNGNMNLNQAREGINVADTDSTLAELQTLLNNIASGA